MHIKRFVSSSMQEALKQVRDELGAEAVILSNEKCSDGVEIVAALDYDEEKAAASLGDDGYISLESSNPSKVARLHAQKHVNLQNELSRVKQHLSHMTAEANSDQGLGTRQESAQGSIDIDAREREMRHQKRLRALHGDSSPVVPRAKRRANPPRNPMQGGASTGETTAAINSSLRNNDRSDAGFGKRARANQDHEIRVADDNTLEDLRKVKAELASLKAMIQDRDRLGSKKSEPIPEPRKSFDGVSLHEDSSWIDISLSQNELRKSRSAKPRFDAQAANGIQVQEDPKPKRDNAQAKILGEIKGRLNAMGLDPKLIQKLSNSSSTGSELDFDKMWAQVMSELESQINAVPGEIIDHGGVIAMVGPTGSGKTTTIGKLAARYVMKFGSSSIALVTTDRYRIAAQEQLKTVGRILNVPVHAVNDQISLDQVLDKLYDKRCVLIDTAGLLPSDPNWSEQLGGLKHSMHRVKSYMVVSAVGQYQVMRANLDQYQAEKLAGAIITKVDEAVSLGELLRFLIDSRMNIAYFADGQRIPDDIHPMDPHALVKKAQLLAENQELNNPERWVTISSQSDSDADSPSVSLFSAS